MGLERKPVVLVTEDQWRFLIRPDGTVRRFKARYPGQDWKNIREYDSHRTLGTIIVYGIEIFHNQERLKIESYLRGEAFSSLQAAYNYAKKVVTARGYNV